jgi:hypothetical protein
MTTATETAPGVVEIVPTGQVMVEGSGRSKGTHTAHYDVICSRCGPVASNLMYPSACKERGDHLCVPKRRGRRG